MSVLLSVVATCVGMIGVVVAANIYDVPPTICYACRWAVFLWVATLDVALFGLAFWTGGYFGG